MKKVTIYTTPTCPYCHMAKAYFDSKKIEFEEIDVTKNPDGAKWIVDNTGQRSVPVIKIDEKVIIGFDKPTIDELLKD